jgi:hypothetical protein
LGFDYDDAAPIPHSTRSYFGTNNTHANNADTSAWNEGARDCFGIVLRPEMVHIWRVLARKTNSARGASRCEQNSITLQRTAPGEADTANP